MAWANSRSRASTTARGYGNLHQKLRKSLEPLVKSGRAICWRCGQPIHPNARWELGHDDWDRSIYRGPEHYRCNNQAAARKGNKLSKLRIKPITDAARW